jgi:hypothetical protein
MYVHPPSGSAIPLSDEDISKGNGLTHTASTLSGFQVGSHRHCEARCCSGVASDHFGKCPAPCLPWIACHGHLRSVVQVIPHQESPLHITMALMREMWLLKTCPSLKFYIRSPLPLSKHANIFQKALQTLDHSALPLSLDSCTAVPLCFHCLPSFYTCHWPLCLCLTPD